MKKAILLQLPRRKTIRSKSQIPSVVKVKLMKVCMKTRSLNLSACPKASESGLLIRICQPRLQRARKFSNWRTAMITRMTNLKVSVWLSHCLCRRQPRCKRKLSRNPNVQSVHNSSPSRNRLLISHNAEVNLESLQTTAQSKKRPSWKKAKIQAIKNQRKKTHLTILLFQIARSSQVDRKKVKQESRLETMMNHLTVNRFKRKMWRRAAHQMMTIMKAAISKRACLIQQMLRLV